MAMALARLIRTVAAVVAVVIVAAIILRLVGANPSNTIVADIHDAGSWLVGPFHGLFSVKDSNLEMGLNWGLAALVYLFVGGLLASLLARGAASSRFSRTRQVA
jgi:hypothetical protein